MSKRKEAKTKAKGLIGEFKEFIQQGNVLDMAVGVIIGGAFGKIVTSLVDNILMPVVGMIIGGIDFSELSVKVGTATLKYGLFIQNVIDFLIIALCIFLFVKAISKITAKKTEEQEEAVAVESKEAQLLEEIRDLLKKRK